MSRQPDVTRQIAHRRGPSKQVGPIPPNITLDTDERTAHWYGVFESATITLD